LNGLPSPWWNLAARFYDQIVERLRRGAIDDGQNRTAREGDDIAVAKRKLRAVDDRRTIASGADDDFRKLLLHVFSNGASGSELATKDGRKGLGRAREQTPHEDLAPSLEKIDVDEVRGFARIHGGILACRGARPRGGL
jgi:hypothetical protein